MTSENIAIARAFNVGCDARLAGQPVTKNPYTGRLAIWWRQGWRDVNLHYGKPLLAVKEAAR